MGLYNPSLCAQARHQFFDWKLETRRGNPIRTTNPLKRDWKLNGSSTPPPNLQTN